MSGTFSRVWYIVLFASMQVVEASIEVAEASMGFVEESLEACIYLHSKSKTCRIPGIMFYDTINVKTQYSCVVDLGRSFGAGKRESQTLCSLLVYDYCCLPDSR